jgi:hypothetical protein
VECFEVSDLFSSLQEKSDVLLDGRNVVKPEEVWIGEDGDCLDWFVVSRSKGSGCIPIEELFFGVIDNEGKVADDPVEMLGCKVLSEGKMSPKTFKDLICGGPTIDGGIVSEADEFFFGPVFI